jgi:hypothetical protein
VGGNLKSVGVLQCKAGLQEKVWHDTRGVANNHIPLFKGQIIIFNIFLVHQYFISPLKKYQKTQIPLPYLIITLSGASVIEFLPMSFLSSHNPQSLNCRTA